MRRPGRPSKLFGTTQDISWLRWAAQAVLDSEQRYREIVEASYEGIWTIDGQERTTFVNARMAEMLGYTAEETIGRPLSEFVPEDYQLVLGERRLRRQLGVSEQMEVEYLRKDGTRLRALISVSALRDPSGGSLGAVAMVNDLNGGQYRARMPAGRAAARP